MTQDFLGTGWSIKQPVDNDKAIAMCGGENDVKEAIWIILSTRKGERVMHPDFGCGIHDFVFEVINAAKIALIKYYIQEALLKWEPRVDVREVSVSTLRLAEGILSIMIQYRIRQINLVQNLVYPFYIKEGR